MPGQIGLEDTPEAYVTRLVEVFREVRRVLADDGTIFLNLGDSYGMGKQLLGMPWRVAFALQDDGWTLRSDIIWHKPNAMPESVRDRPTKSHEYIFLLTKSARYYYDANAVREPFTAVPFGGKDKGYAPSGKDPHLTSQSAIRNGAGRMGNPDGGRNRRSVWTVATKPYAHAHFATFPPALVEPCILAGSAAGDTILDPFAGSGTVGAVAVQHGRAFVGIDINAEYLALAERRIGAAQPPLPLEGVAD